MHIVANARLAMHNDEARRMLYFHALPHRMETDFDVSFLRIMMVADGCQRIKPLKTPIALCHLCHTQPKKEAEVIIGEKKIGQEKL